MSHFHFAVEELTQLIACCPSSNIRRVIAESKVIVPSPQPIDALAAGPSDTHFIEHKVVYWYDAVRLMDPEADFRALIMMIERVVAYFPNNAWTRCFHARALWEIGDYHRAETDLLFALEKQPEYPLAATLLARTYILLQRPQEALNMATLAIHLSPEYPPGYRARVQACRIMAENTQDAATQRMYSAIMLRDIKRVTALLPRLILSFIDDEYYANAALLQ